MAERGFRLEKQERQERGSPTACRYPDCKMTFLKECTDIDSEPLIQAAVGNIIVAVTRLLMILFVWKSLFL